jgi:hypothetical protein
VYGGVMEKGAVDMLSLDLRQLSRERLAFFEKVREGKGQQCICIEYE